LLKAVGIVHFVNPDLIAGGLSPLRPELAALAAGRLFLGELDRLAKTKSDFAFESTLSGRTYVRRLKRWKAAGYRIRIVYLRISSPANRAPSYRRPRQTRWAQCSAPRRAAPVQP
jgi:predicted ABC-type ATPase